MLSPSSPTISPILPRISTTPQPPTLRLNTRWADFHGANNWDGLLDPLHPFLRSEILRYGRLVQAAYTSCDLNPFSPTFATCRFPNHSLLPLSGLPSSPHRITRILHATSSLSPQSNYIGFVALSPTPPNRRDVVISLRGTVTFLEWIDNLRATLTPCCIAKSEFKVERGFWSLFTSSGPHFPSLRDQIREEVANLIENFRRDDEMSITITGHSLGAALAVLAADDVKEMVGGLKGPMVTVVSFGGPRVGNASFRRKMEEQGSRVLRIVNTNDIVTKIPGFVDGTEKEGMAANWLLSKTGWVYADIGRELRVCGRRTANVVACHDLGHYLQLVNQLSDKCETVSREEERGRSGWRGPVFAVDDSF